MSEAVSPQADKHSDRPYDEAVEVSGDEASTPGSSPNPTSGEAGPADALGGASASPDAEFGEGEHQAGTDDSPDSGWVIRRSSSGRTIAVATRISWARTSDSMAPSVAPVSVTSTATVRSTAPI